MLINDPFQSGRLAASNRFPRVVPEHVFTGHHKQWLAGYDAEKANPTIKPLNLPLTVQQNIARNNPSQRR